MNVERRGQPAAKSIDRFNLEKLYIQLARILIGEITDGRWKVGERIPSEDELCAAYEVSKTTVRQAINNLAADGYLMKVQGKGTFVMGDQPTVGFIMKTRPTEERFGKEVHAKRIVLSKAAKAPSPEVRECLKTEGKVLRIRTRTAVDGDTAYLQESFIPTEVLSDIPGRDIVERSLYEVLQERGSRKVFKVVQTVGIGRAAGDVARHLDLAEGQPVLVVDRLFVSSDGTPIAYSRIQGRSDRYKFQTEFERLR